MSTRKENTHKLLLQELKKGNQKAFQKLFELFWEPLFRKAKSLVLDENAAKDIVQNLWVDIWQKREIREYNNFAAYMMKAVHNASLKYIRDRKFNVSHIQVIESLKLTSEAEAKKFHDLEQTQFDIERLLKSLSPRCREIFELSRLEDASNEEIASQLGISKRSVENQISTALKSIRYGLSLTQTLLLLILLTHH